MLFRILSPLAAVVAVAALAGPPLRAADDKLHEATVVKASPGSASL